MPNDKFQSEEVDKGKDTERDEEDSSFLTQ